VQHPLNAANTQEASGETPPSGGGQPDQNPPGPPLRVRGPYRGRRPGRPAATPVGALETRDLILRQARALFMRRGFADVAVGDVAEAVGVTKPTLYYHFGSKEGLYAAVLVDLMREVGGYIRRVVEHPLPLRDRLQQIAVGYFLNANGTMEPLLRDAGQLIGREHAATVWAAYEGDFLEPLVMLMGEGMQSGELRALDGRGLVRGFIGLLDAFTAPGGRSARAQPEHQQVAEAVVSLFLDGAAPRL
jgi:AcrR family transcriptional regulator